MALVSVSIVFAGENIWALIEQANEFEADENLEEASKLWLDIYEYFAKGSSEGDITNAALFVKKLAQYHDYIKDYERAVEYYEEEDRLWSSIGKDWGKSDLLRADEIRTIVEFYVKENGPTNKKLAKYEPENGIYLGIYSENDKKIGQELEKTADVYGEHEIFLFYEDWGNINSQWTAEDGSYESAFNHIIAKKVEKVGGSLQVAMNAMEGLNQVQEDEWIVEWAKAAGQYNIPIFLRFLCEMNGNWVPWNGNPELYKEKFILVHDIMEKYAPNVVMVWCPGDVPLELNGIHADDYYPGDKYVDWVGVNFYVDYYDSGDVDGGNNLYQNPLDHLKYFYEKYSNKKPLMICETGVSHYSVPNNEDLTDWGIANLEKLYGNLPLKYPRVKGITYFSVNQNNENNRVGNKWNNYAISENMAVETVYKRIIKDEYYLSDIDKGVSYHYKQIGQDELVNYDEIYVNAKIVDYKISKAVFYADNVKIAEDKVIPYNINKDLSDTEILKIELYDSKNKLAYSKKYRLKETPSESTNEADKPVESIYEEVTVKIPAFPISLNGYEVDQEHTSYPLLTYNDITYIPLTWDFGQLMGLSTAWSEEIGLVINAGQAPKSINPELNGSNKPGGSYTAQKASGIITVNGKRIDNTKEEYPLLVYNNITYFPLTWRFVVDEFRWKLSFDAEKGLVIEVMNP
ncbi:MAG: glycoside hydrolase family 26 protein [Bacillota bacterium]